MTTNFQSVASPSKSVFTHLIGSCEIFSGYDKPKLVYMHLLSLCHVSPLTRTCLVNLITLRWYITSWPFHTQATEVLHKVKNKDNL